MCKRMLPKTSFYANISRSSGINSGCKDCRRELAKANSRRVRFQRLYKIDVDLYDQAVKALDGRCPFCGRKKQLNIDVADDGAIRGVLCQQDMNIVRRLAGASAEHLTAMFGGPNDHVARYLLNPPGLTPG